MIPAPHLPHEARRAVPELYITPSESPVSYTHLDVYKRQPEKPSTTTSRRAREPMSATSPPEMHIVYEAVEGKRKGQMCIRDRCSHVGVRPPPGAG